MPRIFIAIRFPNEFKDKLVRIQNSLKHRGVSGEYCPYGNLHLTLAFIGERFDLPKIREAVSEVVFQPFALSLGKLGSFRTKSGVIWCGIKDRGPVAALARKVREQLCAHGVSFSKLEFFPHISLVQKPSEIVSDIDVPEAEAYVNRIFFMKSERVDGKLVYSEI